MKKILSSFIVGIALANNLTAQYDWGKAQQKYWHYRSRLDYFVVPGWNDGESQVADRRNFGGNSKDQISFGQHSVYFGYYLGVLATEYYLLNYYGQDIGKTRDELLMALQAYINYMDQCENEYYGVPDTYNGFFVRNSVKCDFLDPSALAGEYHLKKLNKNLAPSDNWGNMIPHSGKPGYISINEKSCCGSYGSFNYDHLAFECGEPLSQDEAAGILKGLALVYRCLPATDLLKWTAREIAIKIISYMAFNQPWPEEWWIHDPLGFYVGDGNGGNAIVYSFPFSMIAGYFGGSPALFWGSPTNVNTVWRASWQSMQYWGYGAMNNSMTVNLAAICNCWDGTETGMPWLNTTPEGIQNISNQDYWHGFYNMLYEFLQNTRTIHFGNTTRKMVKDQIADAPDCGPYCYAVGSDRSVNWAASYKFEQDANIQENGKASSIGVYNGLDYMLLYNLFHIIEVWDAHDGVRSAENMPLYYNQKDYVPRGNAPFCFLTGPVLGNNQNPITYKAFNTIETRQIVDLTVHEGQLPDGTIYPCSSNGSASSGNVSYRAGTSIRLLPGFQAKQGTYMRASIQSFDCAQGFSKEAGNGDQLYSEFYHKYYSEKDISTYTGFERPEYLNTETAITNIASDTLTLYAYPNPFNHTTSVVFMQDRRDNTRITVSDIYGTVVAILYEGTLNEGQHEVIFDAAGLPSGTYFCSMESGLYIKTIRVVKTE